MPSNDSVAAAKVSLSHYINRMGTNPPQNLSVGGLSLWLMQKDDGTALGLKLADSDPEAAGRLKHIAPNIAGRLRSLVQGGRRIEAIRELRILTNCSLEQAKDWLNN